MKKFISLILSLIFVLGLVACGRPDSGVDSETIYTTESYSTIVTETEEPSPEDILEDTVEHYLCDSTFIDVILTQVPDIFNLVDIRVTCYTFFLVMRDGTEYVAYTDMEGQITAIYEWDPFACETTMEIYKRPE